MTKRFYSQADVAEDGDGFTVELDGRPLKTPGKQLLRVPSRGIAGLIAQEWNDVKDEIDPMLMPVTRLANVASESLPDRREDLIRDIRQFAGTDLLSYRAPDPSDYIARQSKAWDPWLRWAKDRGVDLRTTNAVMAIDQPDDSLDKVAERAAAHSDFALTLLAHLTAVYGSAVLALAVMARDLPPGEAFDLSRLDETYRAEIWGLDEEDAAQRDALRRETVTLGRLVDHLPDRST